MEAVAQERQRDDDGDQADGDGLDVEHHPRGDLHVAIGDEHRGGGGERGQQHRRKEMRPSAQKDLREVDEAADDRRCRGDVGEEERPRGQRGEDWWQRDARVDVERAGRGGLARECGDADADQHHQAHGDQVGQRRALSGEREDQRDGQRRRGAGSDGGDRLGERLEGRECVVAQPEGLDGEGLGAFGRCGVHGWPRRVEVQGQETNAEAAEYAEVRGGGNSE